MRHRRLLLSAVFFLLPGLAGPANAFPLTGDTPAPATLQQAPEDCSAGGSESGPPAPLQDGDPYCEAGEPEWQDHEGGPGPYDPEPQGEEPADGPVPMSPSSPGGGGGGAYHHWLGAETSGLSTTGMYAGMKVVDPDVQHGTDEFFAQRILVQNCDGSRWFETGMAEIGWSTMYQQQYPFIRESQNGWGVFVNEGIRPNPGDRVYFMLRPRAANDGYWQAFLNSNQTSGWLLLSEFYLGTNVACGNEAYVEIDGTSTSRQISFPTTEWGNVGGGDNGVMLGKPDGQMDPWTTSKPTIESNSAANGRYTVTWFNKYYYWKVDTTAPANRAPNVNVNVSPTSGNRSTSFGANLGGTSDPDGDPLSNMRINWGDGTSTNVFSVNEWWSHKYSTPGTYSVTGYACDNKGACTTSSPKTVTVTDSNSAPTMWLYVSPDQGDVNTTFTAQISGLSDPEGDAIVSTQIDWGDGTTTSGTSGTHRYSAAGRYTVTAIATDSRGATGDASDTVVVCEVYANGTCVSSSTVDDVVDTIEDTTPEPPDPTYDTVCNNQYVDHTSGACTHPDFAQYLGKDSAETISADYLAANAGTPGYCREPQNGKRYRVVYVHTRSQDSRYGALKAELRNKAQRADYMLWKSSKMSGGAGRHFRFVCNAQNEIRIFEWQLPNKARNSHTATFRQLRNKNDYDKTKRHLVFADWPDAMNTSEGYICGWGSYYEDDSAGPTNSNNAHPRAIALAYIRPDICGDSLASSATHEMVHNLGAAMESAPHEHDGAGPGDGHPTDQWDVLGVGTATVSACSDPIFKFRLDCRFDDYFNADPKTPARHTYLADQREAATGVCQKIQDGEVATKCNWNTAWSSWLVGGNP